MGPGQRARRGRLLFLSWAWATALAACGGDTAAGTGRQPPELLPEDDAGLMTLDRDRDGLCDLSEAALGTNPDAIDTDGDRLPDVIELVSGTQPTLPEDPPADALAFMAGERGAGVDFEVRFTVEGDGQALTGWFGPLGTLYRDGDNAERYFAGSRALAAAPIDAARSIEQEAARFEAVLGKTRLSFVLRFELGAEAEERSCARGYPFRYAIKADDGQTRTERNYLLVVGAAEANQLEAAGFCLPSSCD